MSHDTFTFQRAAGLRMVLAVFVMWAASSGLIARAAEQEASAVADFMLDNGMQVVVIPDRRAPVVTHMLWYKVGSADEKPGKSGLAHFFEHLMFKGTRKHEAGAFSVAVARIGGRENAFTSSDYTAYFQQVPPDALESMMAFEADRMQNLILTEEVIGPERDVVLEERNARVDSNPRALLGEEFDATLYQNHPYRIPVIGWRHEIERLGRADAEAFYRRYYVPDNAVLVVAGDVDARTVLSLAERTYGQVPRGPERPARIRPGEPEHDTRRTVTLTDPRVSVPSLRKAWVVPSYASARPGEGEALDLLAEILGGGIRSRIYQELVVRQGIARSAGAHYRGGALDAGDFGVYASPRGRASVEDVEQALDGEIDKIADQGVSETELERAKKRFVRSMIFARDSQAGMARIYGSTLTTGGAVEDIEQWPQRIRAVTAGQVRAAAATYLDASRSVSGYLLPQSTASQDESAP